MVTELRHTRYFDLIRRHGSSCLAYSTLQPGLHYHECGGIDGFVAPLDLHPPAKAIATAAGPASTRTNAGFISASTVKASESACRAVARGNRPAFAL